MNQLAIFSESSSDAHSSQNPLNSDTFLKSKPLKAATAASTQKQLPIAFTPTASSSSNFFPQFDALPMKGPSFMQEKFKRDIDRIHSKVVEEDIIEMRRNPNEDYQQQQQQHQRASKQSISSSYNNNNNNNRRQVMRTEYSENNPKVEMQGFRPPQVSSSFSSKPNINISQHYFKDIYSNEDENMSNIMSFQNDEHNNFNNNNHSFELSDPPRLNQKTIMSARNPSNSNSHRGIISAGDEELERFYAAQTNLKNLGIPSKMRSVVQQEIISSVTQSQQQIDFLKMNDSTMSPIKFFAGGNGIDLGSKQFSDIGTPSHAMKSRGITGAGISVNGGGGGTGFGFGGSSTHQNILSLQKIGNTHISVRDYPNEPSQMDRTHSHREEGFQGIWATNAFLILTLTKKFINNLKQLSMRYKFGQMKPRYFDLIDDKSSDQDFYRLSGILKSYQPSFFDRQMNRVQKLFNRNFVYIENPKDVGCLKKFSNWLFTLDLGVLLPDSPSKIIWDCIILFLLCLNVFYIPLKISFEEISNMDDYLLIFFEDLPSWAFLCDIIFTFNRAYYSKGVIIQERSKIFKHYLRGSFTWEMIIVVPFLFSSLFNVKYLNIILLFRSNKILNIVSSFEEMLNLRQFQATVMSLIKLIFTIIYIAHICGCFFYYMHVLQIQNDDSTITWVIKFQLLDSGWVSLYISSVYWAVITMITLGYGDIYPITTVEKIYVIIVTLISCGVFAYAVNFIGYILQEYSKRSSEFRIKMSTLTNHMRKRDLSNNMQMKVKKYFEYFMREEQEDNQDGQVLLNSCTTALRNEVLTEMYSKVLASRKEFRLNFSKQFLEKLAPKMHELRLNPEEIIFSENDFNKRVYFLMRGNVALQRTRSSATATTTTTTSSTNEKSAQNTNNATIPTTTITASETITTIATSTDKHQDINIKILKKGDLFGLESFLSGSESLVSAKSLNVVQLVYLQKDDFMQVLQEFNSDKERYFMIKDRLNLLHASRGLGINCYLCDSFVHQFLHCPYMSYQPNHKKVIFMYQQDHHQERLKVNRESDHNTKAIANIHLTQELAIKHLIQNNPFDTINELIERIQVIDDEGGLQIDTPHFIAQYIKDPIEYEDADDMGDDDDAYDDFNGKRSGTDGFTPLNKGMSGVYEESFRHRKGTIGSSSRHDKIPIINQQSIQLDQPMQQQQQSSHLLEKQQQSSTTLISQQQQQQQQQQSQNQQQSTQSHGFRRIGSLRMNRHSVSNIPPNLNQNQPGSENFIDNPKQPPEERRSARRKHTMFSDRDKVYIFKGSAAGSVIGAGSGSNDSPLAPTTGPGQRRLRQTSSFDASNMLIQNENVNVTPILQHHMPSTPNLDRNIHKSVKRNTNNNNNNNHHARIPAEIEEEPLDPHLPQQRSSQQQFSRLNSQISASHIIEYPRSVSINNNNNLAHNLNSVGNPMNVTVYPQQSQVLMATKEFMNVGNFDTHHEWKEYFPHNNLSIVISQFSKLLEKRLLAKKKKKRGRNQQNQHLMQNSQSQKLKILFSNMQARNQQKTNSNRFNSKNMLPRTSLLITSRRESQLHQFTHQLSIVQQPSSPLRDVSRSVFSQLDNNFPEFSTAKK